MKKTNIILFCFIFIFYFCLHSHAEIIYLKNGMQMDGQIIEENDKEVRLEVYGGIIVLQKSTIKEINRGEAQGFPVNSKKETDSSSKRSPEKIKDNVHATEVKGYPGILMDEEHGFSLRYPDTWTAKVSDPKNLLAKYGLNILKYYTIKDRENTLEISAYVLDNPEKKPISGFLTVKKESKKSKVEYMIPRTVHNDVPVPYVEVGYIYDPPLWGMIKGETESIHSISPAKYVYIQIAVSKWAKEYLDTVKSVINSVEKK